VYGFISENAVLPAEYCELGIIKFKNDLDRFSEIVPSIQKSLTNKINDMKNVDLVLPPSLRNLVQ
jgi:hypothetical protein